MKTLFRNRLFFIPFAIFLVFPFTHFFEISNPFSTSKPTTTTMSQDKKEIFGKLLAEYNKLQSLEAKFPALKAKFAAAPDAAVFEPIRTSIAKKIAEMQAAQADKNALTTATPPPPNPDPDDDPNINKDDFGSILETWATKQKSTLESFISDSSIANSTFNTEILKGAIPKGEIRYKVIDDMKKAAHNVVVVDEMRITDAAKSFIKCIDDNYPKTPEALKKLFGEDRKHYKGASEATFRLALSNVDFAGWMTAEYTKAKAKEATLISQDKFIYHTGLLVTDITNKLSKHQSDSFTVKTKDILDSWNVLFIMDSQNIFTPLKESIRALDTLPQIADFYAAVENCNKEHFSAEALTKIPAERYKNCSYVIELSNNGQLFVDAAIKNKYDWNNIFADWLKKWQSESLTSINKQDTFVKEILVEPTVLQLLGKSTFLKTKVPMLAYIADEWLKKFPKTATAITVEMLNDLSEIIKTVCSRDSSQTPLKEQLEVFKAGKGDIPSIDTLLNCLTRFNITAEPYCNIIQNWISSTNGCAAAVEREEFMVERLNTNLPILFADKIDGLAPVQFISDIFKKHLTTVANAKPKISKIELATIWNNTVNELQKSVLENQFNILRGALKNDSISIHNLIEDLHLYLPAKESINFAFEQSAYRKPIQYIPPTNSQVPNPNNNPNPIPVAKPGSSIAVNVTFKEKNTGKNIPPVSIAAQLALSDIELEHIETKFKSPTGYQNLKFAKISSAKAILKNIGCSGCEITNTAVDLSFTQITMPTHYQDSVRGEIIFNLQLKTPSYTLQKYTAAETNQVLSVSGTALTVAGGLGTAAFLTPPIGWIGLIGFGVASAAGAWLSSEAKGEPSNSTMVVPGFQVEIQIMLPYQIHYKTEGDDVILVLDIATLGSVHKFSLPEINSHKDNFIVNYAPLQELKILSATK